MDLLLMCEEMVCVRGELGGYEITQVLVVCPRIITGNEVKYLYLKGIN